MLFDSVFYSFNFGFINLTLLRLFVIFYFLVYVFSHLSNKSLFMHKKVMHLLYLFWFWLLYLLISLIWSVNITNSIKGINFFILFFILIYLIIKFMNTVEIAKSINDIFFVFTIIVTSIGLIEILTGFHLPTSRLMDFDNTVGNTRVATGPFYNENDFSVFLSICFPFIMQRIFKSSLINKLTSAILLSIMIIIVIINDAKLVLIAMGIQFLILLFVLNISILRKFMITIFSVILIMLVVSNNPQITDSFNTIKNDLNNQGGSTYIRINLIKNALYLASESNYLGIGIDNFPLIVKTNKIVPTFGFTDPHNWWMELLVEQGIIIFTIFIYLFIWMLKFLLKIYLKRTSLSRTSFTLFQSLIGLAVASNAPSSFFFYMPMWFLIGVSLAVINVSLYQDSVVEARVK